MTISNIVRMDHVPAGGFGVRDQRRLLKCLASVETVIWDFDGVIAETEPLHLRAFNEVLGACGHLLTEDEFVSYVGLKETEIWSTLLRARGLTERAIASSLDVLIGARDAAFRRLARSLEPRPVALEMLHVTRDRDHILVSSQRADVVIALLTKWNLVARFKEIHALGGVRISKAAALVDVVSGRRAGGRAWTGALIEDAAEPLILGHELGLLTVRVVHRFSNRLELPVDFTVDVR